MLNRHFYSSLGVGMKRLIHSGAFPTLRWNVGIGF
jgi:hypothetical protein